MHEKDSLKNTSAARWISVRRVDKSILSACPNDTNNQFAAASIIDFTNEVLVNTVLPWVLWSVKRNTAVVICLRVKMRSGSPRRVIVYTVRHQSSG